MCFNTLSSRNKAILSCLSDRPRPAWRSCEAPRLESFSKGKSPCLENWEALALFVRRRTKSLISLIMLKSTTWRLTWRSVLQTFLTSWCVMISRTLVARCPGWQTTSKSLWPYSKLPGRNAAQVRSPVAQVEMQMSFLQIVSMSTAWTN